MAAVETSAAEAPGPGRVGGGALPATALRRLGMLPTALLAGVAAERGRLFPWTPVALSLGIGPWFTLSVEPGWRVYLAAFGLLLAGFAAWRRGGEVWQLPGALLMLMAMGFLLIGARAHSLAGPVLTFRYYGPVEGRIVGIDRSFSDQLRLTLDQVVLENTPPERTPLRVRVAMHGEQGFILLEPGIRVMLTGHLSPPGGPAEPGGFDFQILAWFARLGGVGYTRSPVLVLEPAASDGARLALHRARMRVSAAMQERMPGQSGALAAALMTGDRSGINAATDEVMRASNLYHLISISGLHMGLLTGFVFLFMRHGLSLVPPLALRLPVKKLAAAVALAAAGFYLALSGMNVASVRAFLMVAVMLCAVLLDRRAITLRSVAIAALLILMVEPESLVEPGFQMSFGATTALVAVFGLLGRWQGRVPKPLVPVLTLLLSSIVAGAATAPIAAAHFNRVPEYGLLANMLAVPLTGFLVMPAGVIAALLSLVGLEGPALWVLDLGCKGIIATANWVSGMEGAVFFVPAPAALVLPALSLGALLALLTGSWAPRLAGLALMVAGFFQWAQTERPALLISGDGGLLGLMTSEGRALSKESGSGFIAQSWLEDDGDGADQVAAFARAGFSGGKTAMQAELAGVPVYHFTGKGSAGKARSACTPGTVVVLTEKWEGGEAACLLYDLDRLRQTGALAVRIGPEGLRFETSREVAGIRLWNRPAPRRPRSGARQTATGS